VTADRQVHRETPNAQVAKTSQATFSSNLRQKTE
jgi:hypothetical protein